MLSLYRDCLQPRFMDLAPENGQFESINAMVSGLNTWFRAYFATVKCGVYGTITYPAAATVFGTPVSPIMIGMPVYETFSLITPEVIAAVSVPEGGLVSLFTYIGAKITACLTTWTASPTIIGICAGPLVTANFAVTGTKLLSELSTIPSDTENLTEIVWNKIEQALKDAMNQIPEVPVPLVGTAVGGAFTGMMQIGLKGI